MVNTAKIEAEVESIAAETTSVISGMLGALNPRWPRFVETWRSWPRRKKAIAFMVSAVICGFVSAFGMSTLRLMAGSYRSAYAYGHGSVVTKEDLQGSSETTLANAKALFATRAQINDIEAHVHQIEVELNAVETRLSTAPSKITTGSNPEKKSDRKGKRTVPKKSSFSVINPSTWP